MRHLLRSVCVIGALLIAGKANAGESLKEKIQKMADYNARAYVSPLVSGFGVAMNSGVYRSPETHSVLGFDFQLVTSMAFAGSSEKTFVPKLPPGYNNVGESASTAIGSKNKKTYSNGIPDQDIVIAGAGIPAGASGFFVAPQLTVGVPYKTDVILRFVPGIPAGNVGKISLFGLGAKHNLNQWIPIDLPIDLAAGIFYQKMSIGSVFKSKATNFDILAGKSLNLLILKVGLYGGFGIESSSMDVKYSPSANVKDQNGDPVTSDVKLSIDGKNKGRGFVGANIRLLWLVNVNAELGFGKYRSAAIGVGLTLR